MFLTFIKKMNYYTASSNIDLWPNKLQDKINTYNILK